MDHEEHFGYKKINELSKILDKEKPKKIFLITGKSSYEKSGAKFKLEPTLNKYNIIRFSDYTNNPKLEDIKKGLNIVKKEKSDFIIGIGGGTVMDIAKTISALTHEPHKLKEYVTNRKIATQSPTKLVLIPTTAGTGSEATNFSVIYIGKTKYSLKHNYYCNYSIIDPELTFSLPPYITACTGIDALGQAIESYWSVKSTLESKTFSKKAIKLALKNIEGVVNNPNKENRKNMLLCANLGGKAINISKTTAAHSVSYPMTSYFEIPHGHAVGLTIPSFFLFNSELEDYNLQDKRGLKYINKTMKELKEILGVKTFKEGKELLDTLIKNIGLEQKLSKLKVDKEGINTIVKNGFNPQRIINNPKKITEEELKQILIKIL